MLDAATRSAHARLIVDEGIRSSSGHLLPTAPGLQGRLERARRAGSAFLRGTTAGWGRRELAEWLVCHYAPCAATSLHPESAGDSPASERTLDEGILERVLVDARGDVLRLLADLVMPGQASPIARLALACGTVVAQRDAHGAVAYAPVGAKRLRLGERVASLFIADYLNHPADYRSVTLCRECGEIAFASELEHQTWCTATVTADNRLTFNRSPEADTDQNRPYA